MWTSEGKVCTSEGKDICVQASGRPQGMCRRNALSVAMCCYNVFAQCGVSVRSNVAPPFADILHKTVKTERI